MPGPGNALLLGNEAAADREPFGFVDRAIYTPSATPIPPSIGGSQRDVTVSDRNVTPLPPSIGGRVKWAVDVVFHEH